MRYGVLRESKGIHHVIVSMVTVGNVPHFDIVATYTTRTSGSWWQAAKDAQDDASRRNGDE